jgi:meckelin
MKFLTIAYKIIFEQTSFDIFLVDWEKPKPRKGNPSEMGINAWRSLFLLNEFNELQTAKLISIEFTLITFAFFMEGLGWRYTTTFAPTLDTSASANSPENFVLNFFITAILMYIIGTAQYLFQYMIKFKFALKAEEFTDLCSICNISILMFDNSFHGYYIHGRSPFG